MDNRKSLQGSVRKNNPGFAGNYGHSGSVPLALARTNSAGQVKLHIKLRTNGSMFGPMRGFVQQWNRIKLNRVALRYVGAVGLNVTGLVTLGLTSDVSDPAYLTHEEAGMLPTGASCHPGAKMSIPVPKRYLKGPREGWFIIGDLGSGFGTMNLIVDASIATTDTNGAMVSVPIATSTVGRVYLDYDVSFKEYVPGLRSGLNVSCRHVPGDADPVEVSGGGTSYTSIATWANDFRYACAVGFALNSGYASIGAVHPNGGTDYETAAVASWASYTPTVEFPVETCKKLAQVFQAAYRSTTRTALDAVVGANPRPYVWLGIRSGAQLSTMTLTAHVSGAGFTDTEKVFHIDIGWIGTDGERHYTDVDAPFGYPESTGIVYASNRTDAGNTMQSVALVDFEYVPRSILVDAGIKPADQYTGMANGSKNDVVRIQFGDGSDPSKYLPDLAAWWHLGLTIVGTVPSGSGNGWWDNAVDVAI